MLSLSGVLHLITYFNYNHLLHEPEPDSEEVSPRTRLMTETSPGALAANGLADLEYYTPETGR